MTGECVLDRGGTPALEAAQVWRGVCPGVLIKVRHRLAGPGDLLWLCEVLPCWSRLGEGHLPSSALNFKILPI